MCAGVVIKFLKEIQNLQLVRKRKHRRYPPLRCLKAKAVRSTRKIDSFLKNGFLRASLSISAIVM